MSLSNSIQRFLERVRVWFGGDDMPPDVRAVMKEFARQRVLMRADEMRLASQEIANQLEDLGIGFRSSDGRDLIRLQVKAIGDATDASGPISARFKVRVPPGGGRRTRREIRARFKQPSSGTETSATRSPASTTRPAAPRPTDRPEWQRLTRQPGSSDAPGPKQARDDMGRVLNTQADVRSSQQASAQQGALVRVGGDLVAYGGSELPPVEKTPSAEMSTLRATFNRIQSAANLLEATAMEVPLGIMASFPPVSRPSLPSKGTAAYVQKVNGEPAWALLPAAKFQDALGVASRMAGGREETYFPVKLAPPFPVLTWSPLSKTACVAMINAIDAAFVPPRSISAAELEQGVNWGVDGPKMSPTGSWPGFAQAATAGGCPATDSGCTDGWVALVALSQWVSIMSDVNGVPGSLGVIAQMCGVPRDMSQFSDWGFSFYLTASLARRIARWRVDMYPMEPCQRFGDGPGQASDPPLGASFNLLEAWCGFGQLPGVLQDTVWGEEWTASR